MATVHLLVLTTERLAEGLAVQRALDKAIASLKTRPSFWTYDFTDAQEPSGQLTRATMAEALAKLTETVMEEWDTLTGSQ